MLLLAVPTARGRAMSMTFSPAAMPIAVVAQLQETPVDAMNPQMRRAYIVGIQEELAAHGYRPGPADGVPGSKTRAAIRAYQRDAGLKVTGVATKELLDHLKFALPKIYARKPSAPRQSTAVYVGLVKEVQSELHQRGYYHGTIDGIEGPQTRAAITEFQRDAGLPVTGMADATLLKQLLEASPDLRRSG